jgi:nickel/cobalt transporter (NicO) family protein
VTTRHVGRYFVGFAIVAVSTFAAFAPTAASAHPLGNFSINHSHSLTVSRDRVTDSAVVDFAEIPTKQAERDVDTNGDGDVSPTEASRFADATCESVRTALLLKVDSNVVVLANTAATFAFEPGQAGLVTSRLTCSLEAPVDVSSHHTVSFTNNFDRDHVGWREIIAIGDGVQLIDSTVPEVSATETLRSYPAQVLESPLNVRDVTLTVAPATSVAPATVQRASDGATASARPQPALLRGGPLAAVVDRVSDRFNRLVGRRDLTLGVGLLAIALAAILGASHALLPGHGKTVMAAYIAGRQGSSRDALVVGATVTATHTGGVLVLGLALTLSSAIAGATVLSWLGLASGLLIAALGAGLARGAFRRRGPTAPGHHDHHGHDHHGHDHHGHDHDHDHHGHGHDHYNHHGRAQVSRRGLVGMGIAGGLVPSPSALVVLLSAIALGRTTFGVILVLAYGLGMAATLTVAGLLLVRVRDRLQQRASARAGLGSLTTRWLRFSPYATALLIVAVGIGLALRSATTL